MKDGDAMTGFGARKTLSAQTGDVLRSSRERFLMNAALLYGTGLVLHTADHIRRGLGVLTPEVFWLGGVSTIVGVVTIVLVFARHPRAPLIAAIMGFQVALGTSAVHLLPHWSSFSDALPGARGTGVTAFSFVVVNIEIVGAFLLGIAGANLLFHQRKTEQGERLARDVAEHVG
jgi:hypothetical protein